MLYLQLESSYIQGRSAQDKLIAGNGVIVSGKRMVNSADK